MAGHLTKGCKETRIGIGHIYFYLKSTTHLALDPTPASIYITLSEQALYVNNTDIEKICQSWSRPNVEGQRLHCQLPVACSTLPGLPGLPGGPWCPMMLATLDGESSDRSPSRLYCCLPHQYSYNQAICGDFLKNILKIKAPLENCHLNGNK